MIENPILKGFNPDPSIIRVDNDYYIATSTFEWFPGVQIHHSQDLKNWKLVTRPLSRIEQLDLKGVPDSCGVWAPCLSYHDGIFYLVYSVVRSFDGVWKDTPNFLVTTSDILGDWSDPIFLGSSGFDGSLFHQSNGKKWFLSMLVDHRSGRFFGGIVIQEFCTEKKQLKGDKKLLTPGSTLGLSEGPHLFEKDGFFYLILAEGGTEYGHAISVARSTALFGPYEFHPDNPIVSSKDVPEHSLQKAGHGDLIETSDGDWYIVFLVGRPLSKRGRCVLGRETAIEEIVWKDGWPQLKHGTCVPRIEIPLNLEEPNAPEMPTNRMHFNTSTLDIHFQSLRIPVTSNWCSLTERPGYLRLYGGESLTSTFKQSLVARRVKHFFIEVGCALQFNPNHFQEMAGLVFYYNTGHYHYACVSGSENGQKKHLSIFTADNFGFSSQETLEDVSTCETIFLKAKMKKENLQFFFSRDNVSYHTLGTPLDASILSDDYVREESDRYRPAFTGCFVGLCCQDLALHRKHADFEWFEYREEH